MANPDEEAQRRLVAIFRVEAQERLAALSSGLIELEKAEQPDRRGEILEVLVREAHSLKGAARAVSVSSIEAVAKALERVLSMLHQHELTGSVTLFDALHQGVDGVAGLLKSPAMDADGDTVRRLTDALDRAAAKPPEAAERPPTAQVLPPVAETPPETAAPAAERGVPPETARARVTETPLPRETVRIATDKLSALMLEAEQLLSTRLAEEHYVAELNTINREIADWRKALGRFRSAAARGTGPAPTEWLQEEAHRLKVLEGKLGRLERLAEHNLRALGTSLGNLLDDIKSVLMLPAATLLELFPKMVRDLSRAQDKEIDLTVAGGDIAIDKRVLDDMKDPLIHLVRNSIDHGIETPEARQAKGKSARGRLLVGIAPKDVGKVEITVSDDGAGIDADRIRASAVRRGLVAAADAEKLAREDVLALALRPGVTTSAIVTDVSGRGLGLAIVQEKVLKLNGVLDFETGLDTGTTFRMILPLSLSTFRGVVVRCAGRLFIVPTANVEQVLRTDRAAVKSVENRTTLAAAGQVLALVGLADALELAETPLPAAADKLRVVILSAANRRIAFLVDAIEGEQEVLVKPLGKQLARVRNVSGVALLGTGDVVPILNVQDLLISAVKRAAGGAPRMAAEVTPVVPRSLMVVEDSITTRTLLRNILESAGYTVQTAVDGVDALEQLREGQFDAVISDVAMPRMDGFELTARIRADPQLSALPVILVTALESREDRERGVRVGANAYIVKSRFDQSNLFETIRRLL
jgi:two-component system chemotaxis sensor kinase CheA